MCACLRAPYHSFAFSSILFLSIYFVYRAHSLFLLQNNYNILGLVHYWKPRKFIRVWFWELFAAMLKLKWKTIYAFREIFMHSRILCTFFHPLYILHNIAEHCLASAYFTEDSNYARQQRQRIIKVAFNIGELPDSLPTTW